MSAHSQITEAISVLVDLGFPREQQNERSALCLLALLNLTPERSWREAQAPTIGVTPIMNWVRTHYQKEYAPNTRETFRRQTIHQFLAAGLILQNPDNPTRAVNSPATVYQIEPTALRLMQSRQTQSWADELSDYLVRRPTLIARFAAERQMPKVPIQLPTGQELRLSAGKHSELTKAVLEEFAPRFSPGAIPIYVGDTGNKWAYFDESLLGELGVHVDQHGKMPDIVLYDQPRNWLFLVEAVTSHGPIDGKRHAELATLFHDATCSLVFVTAFFSRSVMARYMAVIAWETEVWLAETPSHLIHFNGQKFLGPYSGDE